MAPPLMPVRGVGTVRIAWLELRDERREEEHAAERGWPHSTAVSGRSGTPRAVKCKHSGVKCKRAATAPPPPPHPHPQTQGQLARFLRRGSPVNTPNFT